MDGDWDARIIRAENGWILETDSEISPEPFKAKTLIQEREAGEFSEEEAFTSLLYELAWHFCATGNKHDGSKLRIMLQRDLDKEVREDRAYLTEDFMDTFNRGFREGVKYSKVIE